MKQLAKTIDEQERAWPSVGSCQLELHLAHRLIKPIEFVVLHCRRSPLGRHWLRIKPFGVQLFGCTQNGNLFVKNSVPCRVAASNVWTSYNLSNLPVWKTAICLLASTLTR